MLDPNKELRALIDRTAPAHRRELALGMLRAACAALTTISQTRRAFKEPHDGNKSQKICVVFSSLWAAGRLRVSSTSLPLARLCPEAREQRKCFRRLGRLLYQTTIKETRHA